EGFMEAHKLPTGYWDTGLVKQLNDLLKKETGVDALVREDGKIGASYQVNYDMELLARNKLDISVLKKLTVDYLKKQPGVMYAVDMEKVNEAPVPDWIKTAMINGYNYKRSGPVQVIPEPGWMPEYSKKGTTHGGWNP